MLSAWEKRPLCNELTCLDAARRPPSCVEVSPDIRSAGNVPMRISGKIPRWGIAFPRKSSQLFANFSLHSSASDSGIDQVFLDEIFFHFLSKLKIMSLKLGPKLKLQRKVNKWILYTVLLLSLFGSAGGKNVLLDCVRGKSPFLLSFCFYSTSWSTSWRVELQNPVSANGCR